LVTPGTAVGALPLSRPDTSPQVLPDLGDALLLKLVSHVGEVEVNPSGSRFLSFAERSYSLDSAITPEALERVRHTGAIVDPDRLVIGPPDAADEVFH
jgi:hypothetical protein